MQFERGHRISYKCVTLSGPQNATQPLPALSPRCVPGLRSALHSALCKPLHCWGVYEICVLRCAPAATPSAFVFPVPLRRDLEAKNHLEFSESFLAGMADWADQAARAGDSINYSRDICGKRGRFKAEFLIHSLLIASMLRKDNHLGEVAESVMNALLPPISDDWFRTSGLSYQELVPDKGTISRMRLPFLASYACCCHERWAALGDAGLFLQVDASPQFGRDWLITVCTFTPRSQLLQLSEWLAELYSLVSPPDVADDDVPEPALLRRKELAARVSDVMQHHVLPAGGLGSGRASLLHKVHCFLHCMALSFGSWDNVFVACSKVIAFTVDQGTEAGFRKIKRSAISSSFLPSLFTESQLDTMDNLMMDTGIFQNEEADAADDHQNDQQQQHQPGAGGSPSPSAAAAEPPSAAGAEGMAAEHEPEDPENEHEPGLLFDKALVIPGALHILHSAAREITDAMTHFKEYEPDLRLIVEMLSHQWMRERFFACCLMSPEAAGYRDLFSTMVTISLAEWRWGHLMQAISEVLLRMTPLRCFWSSEKMLFRERPSAEQMPGDREHPARASEASILKITKVIEDPFFWAYSFCLRSLGSLVKDFELYCYSCDCHPERARRCCKQEESFSEVTRLTKLLAGDTCCMAGRITPNFATGQWRLKFDEFARQRSGDMMVHCCSLQPHERALVVSDWGCGRSRLYMTMDVKFSFFDRLPHKLLGCAHHDPSLARQCALECIQLWAELLHASGLDEASASAGNIHPLIVDVFAGPLRLDFEHFAMNRKPLSAMPELQVLLTTWRLCTVLEVAVEGKHSLAKLRVRQRKRATPAMMTFELQINEIRKWLHESPDNFNCILDHFKDMRSTSSYSEIMYKFGMMNHSYIQWSLENHGRLRLRDLSLAFFHCDPITQFLDYSELKGNHLEAAMPDLTAGAKRGPFAIEDVIWRAAWQHCVATCHNRAIYSCSLAGDLQLERLSDRMQFQPVHIARCLHDEVILEYAEAIAPVTPPLAALQEVEMAPLTDDCDMDKLFLAGDRSNGLLGASLAHAPPSLVQGEAGMAEAAIAAVASAPVFFFRVAGQPHRMKRLRGTHGHDTNQHDLAVTLHQALRIDHDNGRAVIEADAVQHAEGSRNSSSPICLWSPCKGLSLPALQCTLLQWDILDDIEFMWPESIKAEISGHPGADHLIKKLIAADAIEVPEVDHGVETYSVFSVWKDGSQA